MPKPPATEQKQVNFRMPFDLYDRIKAAAEANNRSMNAEIVATLEKEYPAPKEPSFRISMQEFQAMIALTAIAYGESYSDAEKAKAEKRLQELKDAISAGERPEGPSIQSLGPEEK